MLLLVFLSPAPVRRWRKNLTKKRRKVWSLTGRRRQMMKIICKKEREKKKEHICDKSASYRSLRAVRLSGSVSGPLSVVSWLLCCSCVCVCVRAQKTRNHVQVGSPISSERWWALNTLNSEWGRRLVCCDWLCASLVVVSECVSHVWRRWPPPSKLHCCCCCHCDCHPQTTTTTATTVSVSEAVDVSCTRDLCPSLSLSFFLLFELLALWHVWPR